MKTRLYGIICGVCLVAMACVTMLGLYSDMLVTAQDRNTFMEGWDFFVAMVTSKPFGMMEWAGAAMTQLFFWPVVGTLTLVAVWLLTGGVLTRALRLKGVWQMAVLLPLACLLASILDVGYWIYLLVLRGYWFAQSLGYLCVALVLLGATRTTERWRWAWYAVPVVLFPLVGWTAYLMAAVLLLSHRPKLADVAGVALTAVAPLVWHGVAFSGVLMREVWLAGFPLFESTTVDSIRPAIPFFALVAVTLLLVVSPKVEVKKMWLGCVVSVAVVAVSVAGIWKTMFWDENYLAEMRMTQAAMVDDWQAVLKDAQAAKRPSRTMVLLKNVALANTGELGETSFLIGGNNGEEINNPDQLNMNTMQIAAPVIYYHFGYENYAIRWCLENAVGYGFSPYYLKVLARCGETTGEKEMTARYLTCLHKTLCYSDWKPLPPTKLVKEMYRLLPDILDADYNSCDHYLIETISTLTGSNVPEIQELCLFNSILMRDATKFWPALVEYVASHKGKPMPLHFQEAYVMFEELKKLALPLDVDIYPQIRENYKQFWSVGQGYADMGMTPSQVAEAMREDWGGTYWWYNAFGRSEY